MSTVAAIRIARWVSGVAADRERELLRRARARKVGLDLNLTRNFHDDDA